MKKSILITGGTGYVGGRLLKMLDSEDGYRIIALARNPENIDLKELKNTTAVKGDLFEEPEVLAEKMEGVDMAYYLVHSLGAKNDFVDLEYKAAQNFALAAKQVGIKKIIYLGGLGEGTDLSPHLESRHKVGQILKNSSDAAVIEFRASIILGSGSLSFDLIRSLSEKLPFMITPKWVSSLAQPISIRNVLDYLAHALDERFDKSKIYEIGGSDIVSYGDLMREYARQRNLKRLMIKVPFLTPHLSSLWLGLVTPVYARIGKKLIESLIHDTTVKDLSAKNDFNIDLISYKDAIAKAIENEDNLVAQTFWYDSISSAGNSRPYGGQKFKSRVIDCRHRRIDVSASECFEVIQKIGGTTGWYYANFLWRIRGFLDLLVGGVGMRRGRKHPIKIKVGDPIDFWRVQEFTEDSVLFLKAEMKVPGRAWLKFEVKEEDSTSCTLTQTAIFDPLGLFGLIYWYSLFPVHAVMFKGMINSIADEAKNSSSNKK